MSTRPAPSRPRDDRLLPRPRARERVPRDPADTLPEAGTLDDPEPAEAGALDDPEPAEAEGAEDAAGAASPQVLQ
jgi:hypothetical protein